MAYHKTANYLLNPTHKITIKLIGLGGTGTQVLSALARTHMGLVALGHPGIHVIGYDPDIISTANVGRQLYSIADIGLNKAIVSISRINRFFGFEWEAVNKKYGKSRNANITISCVDTAKARIQIGTILREESAGYDDSKSFYWLDFGNSQDTGQVILGTVNDAGLKTVDQMFDLSKIKEKNQGPSCSLAEAIGKQDLFINSTLANLGCNLLWKLFTEGRINYHGLYLNLKNMQVRPIPVQEMEVA